MIPWFWSSAERDLGHGLGHWERRLRCRFEQVETGPLKERTDEVAHVLIWCLDPAKVEELKNPTVRLGTPLSRAHQGHSID